MAADNLVQRLNIECETRDKNNNFVENRYRLTQWCSTATFRQRDA